MFAHIFRYRLKCLLRDRETIFWTLVFPLILAVLFNMAFSNLNKVEGFSPIDIAVVDNRQYQEDQYFKMTLKEVSQGDDRLFNLVVVSEDEANKLLNENSIAGYIVVEDSVKLVVNQTGIEQSIIKSFLDNYIQTLSAVNSILTLNPAGGQELFNELGNRYQYIREVPIAKAEPNNKLLYFYSLIAMACLYGSFFGMREINDTQPNITPLAARINTAPVHKLKLFIYSMSASILIHITEIFILLLFLRFVINVDFGTRTVYVILTAIVGSVVGNAFGAFISATVKKDENLKIGISICVSMVGSFLSGMMYQNMKYIVAQKVPLLSYLNPVNLLTDAFYCLYYYDSLEKYALNMSILLIFILAFCSGIYLMVRRRKYASI